MRFLLVWVEGPLDWATARRSFVAACTGLFGLALAAPSSPSGAKTSLPSLSRLPKVAHHAVPFPPCSQAPAGSARSATAHRRGGHGGRICGRELTQHPNAFGY